jgi:SAM-dependent methyltransferase
MSLFRSWLEHPLLKGIDLDDPLTMYLRRQIILEKPFLHKIYQEWYSDISAVLPAIDGPILEIGSGAGFFKDVVPNLLSSDILFCPWVYINLDGHLLPFSNNALRAIVMVNVFHHLSNPKIFLLEVSRCIKPGGTLIMVEPWVTKWSRIIYTNFHSEPFDPEASAWNFLSTGPLSGANNALAWIVFERDRQIFLDTFPKLSIGTVNLMMPFRYLLSGGISMRALVPSKTYRIFRAVEHFLEPMSKMLSMFAQIVVYKV